MVQTIEQQLAKLQNRGTMWELIATDGQRRILMGYTDRKTRSILWNALTKNATAWAALTGAENFHYDKKAANGGKMGDWKVIWSGRTQRECIIEGKLPYITDVVSPLASAFPDEA